MDERKGRKGWPDEKVLGRALAAKTDKAYWDNICELRGRASAGLYARCAALCRSETSAERGVGMDVLAQFYRRSKRARYGVKFPYRKEVLVLCLELLAVEKEPEIIESVLYAVGWNSPSKKAIDAVMPFIRCEHADVRRAAVAALTGVESMKAVRGLIVLSQDRCVHIRDWATFAIGTQSELDNEEIRRALYARCDDRHHDTRMEAIYGLAKRRDAGVKKYLEEVFPECTVYVLLSIQALDAKEYLPRLEALLEETGDDPETSPYWLGHLKECVETLREG